MPDDDALGPPGELREGRDVRDHEVHVVRIDDRPRKTRVHARPPEPREVLHPGREARARQTVQEHHPRENDVLGVESVASTFEDYRTRAGLPEVEDGREIHVEPEKPRRAPHQVGALVHAVRAGRSTGGGRGGGRPEQRAEGILAAALLGNEEERRRGKEPSQRLQKRSGLGGCLEILLRKENSERPQRDEQRALRIQQRWASEANHETRRRTQGPIHLLRNLLFILFPF